MLPLDRSRHWHLLADLAKQDRLFAEKDDKLVWRGATTGNFMRAVTAEGQDVPYSARFYIAQLTELPPGIDVKYSQIVQISQENCDLPMAKIKEQMGSALTIRDQLSSKFVLCLEGNDVASGLKWLMASNSTPIMPKPTCETWFCEGELQPWVHYVPVADDLSDLKEIYDWCLSHQKACEEIAMNGKAYVLRFLDVETEMQLIGDVARKYAEFYEFDFQFDFAERIRQNTRKMVFPLRRQLFRNRTRSYHSGV